MFRRLPFALLAACILAGCVTIQAPKPVPPVPAPPAEQVEPPRTDAEADAARAVDAYRGRLAIAWRKVATANPKTVQEASDLAKPLVDKARDDFHRDIGEVFKKHLGSGELAPEAPLIFEQFAQGATRAGYLFASEPIPASPPPEPEPETFPEQTEPDQCR